MESILLKVYLQPKSSKNELVGPYRDGIRVKVTAPPVEGKANEALIRFLAKEFRISPSCIEIIKGGHAREKILKISEDVDQEWLKKQLQNDQPCCSGEDVRQRDRMRKGRKADPPKRSNKKIWEDPSTDVMKNLELLFHLMQDVLMAVEEKTMARGSKTLIEKIISGGQTGVDRAALDVGLKLGIPCGGWCPKGRRAEDGPIDVRYPLKETHSASYRIRTEKNVRDSDGTLIFTWRKPKGGTALTIRFAQKYKKPYLIVDLSERGDPETAQDWVEANQIKVLNIAGLRESECPGIYIRTVDFLKEVFDE